MDYLSTTFRMSILPSEEVKVLEGEAKLFTVHQTK